MKRAIATTVFLLGLSAPAWACLWYYGKNVRGESVEYDERDGERSSAFQLLKVLERSRVRISAGPEPVSDEDFRNWSDYAASLVHEGRYTRAIAILEDIERNHPGEYIVAANLGTALELSGRNPEALKWISEGLRRNPLSHGGSEWIHVKILEAKIALAGDRQWLSKNTPLGLDFGTENFPHGRNSRRPSETPPRPGGCWSTSSASGLRSFLLRTRWWGISCPTSRISRR